MNTRNLGKRFEQNMGEKSDPGDGVFKYEIPRLKRQLQSGEDETLEAQYRKCLMREKFFLIVQQYTK